MGRKVSNKFLLSQLGENTYVNRRNGTEKPGPVLVDDAGRLQKQQAVYCPDDTVVRVLGIDSDVPNKVSPSRPSNILEKYCSHVILPWGSLVNVQTENFCCRQCFEPLTISRFERYKFNLRRL